MVIQKNIDETADHSGKLGSLVTLEYRVIATSILLSSPLLLEAEPLQQLFSHDPWAIRHDNHP